MSTRRLIAWASVRGGWRHTLVAHTHHHEATARADRLQAIGIGSPGPLMRVVRIVELREGERVIAANGKEVSLPTELKR